MSRLNQEEQNLLTEVINKRAPQLAPAVTALGSKPLSEAKREEIRQVLLNEMLSDGLIENDEPNHYGRTIDDIIGKLEDY